MPGLAEKNEMFVVIFDTLSTRVEKVINLGFEIGIISLST